MYDVIHNIADIIRKNTDPHQILNFMKRLLIVCLLLGILENPLYFLFLLASFISLRHIKGKRAAISTWLFIFTIDTIWIHISGISIISAIKERSQISLMAYVFRISPWRMCVSLLCSLPWVLFGENITRTHRELTISAKKKEQADRLPPIEFNFKNTSNILIVGITRSGKTVAMVSIMEYYIANGMFCVAISGKNGYAELYSMRTYVAALCRKYGRTLYVVSTNASDPEGRAYNPFAHMEYETLMDSILKVSDYSEEHYRVNMKTYIGYMYDVLKKSGIKISQESLVTYFDYDRLLKLVMSSYNDGLIDEATKDKAADIKNVAKIAKDSAARLDQYSYGTANSILNGRSPINLHSARKENAVVLFDLGGLSKDGISRDVATLACSELCDIIEKESNKSEIDRKLLVFDEVSVFANSDIGKIYSLAQSAGFQSVVGSQTLSMIDMVSEGLSDIIMDNSGQYCILQQEGDAETLSNRTGTVDTSEVTHKTNGMSYDGSGTEKYSKEFGVHPDVIKNLSMGEMIYCQKPKTGKKILGKVKWNYPMTEKELKFYSSLH